MTRIVQNATGLGLMLAVAAACGGVGAKTNDESSGSDPVSRTLVQDSAEDRIAPDTSANSDLTIDELPGSGSASGSGRAAGVLTGTPLLDLFSPARLAAIRASLPRVDDDATQTLFDDAATIWYDRSVIIPGYQDSWGDNVVAPVGFRPNSIAPVMINTAVPGGHSLLFVSNGFFHFPFGVTGGADDAPNAHVVDFWSVPRDATGKVLPVAYWRRDPSSYTHRIVWAFPKGTVFGEVLFLRRPAGAGDAAQDYAYEVRTRTRDVDGWRVNAFRPFPAAGDLATAIEAARARDPRWTASVGAARVLAHARDTSTLVAARLEASHYASSFTPMVGSKDVLPNFDAPELVAELLRTTTFRSAKGVAWKENATSRTWASTTNEEFSIVPKNYHGGFLSVDDATCGQCHQDAGRPFKDYYSQVVAYGELWGEDEIFSWHPFETEKFVDAKGDVKNFNYDNRVMRADFVRAGLVQAYDATKHPASSYKEIPRAWRNYKY